MGLALVAVFLYAGSLSTSEIVAEQAESDVTLLRQYPLLVRGACCSRRS